MELLVYFIVAVFILLKLYSILGKEEEGNVKTDTEGKKYVNAIFTDVDSCYNENININDSLNKEKEDKILNELSVNVKNKIKEIVRIDKSFSIYEFVKGAENAFEMVLKAYEDHDEEFLKLIMSKEVFEKIEKGFMNDFKMKIIPKNILIRFKEICITEIKCVKDIAFITTTISSEQIKYAEDSKGNVVSGSKDRAGIISDSWIFMKDLNSKNKNWKIVSI